MSQIAWRFPLDVVDTALTGVLNNSANEQAPSGETETLHEAMRYAVLNGGKRLRSLLVLESAAIVGGENFRVEAALPAACALEFIHAYSLIHDDLPAMDNADMRRGQPSCHRKYGEALAILAGDALLTLAFEVLTQESELNSTQLLSATQIIARAAGGSGMVGGQTIDIAWSDNGDANVTTESLLQMHAMKTGALIRAACEAGAVLGGGTARQIENLRDYGTHLGRAFQITDDLLDVSGDPRDTGKAATDAANNKATAPAVLGLGRSRELARSSSESAVDALRQFGSEADALRDLARSIVSRKS